MQRDQRDRAADEREASLDEREAHVAAVEADVEARVDEGQRVLSDAERRDALADATSSPAVKGTGRRRLSWATSVAGW